MEDNLTSDENICRSCGTIIEDSFCGRCGQKKYKRIDRKYLIDELQYTVFHMNKGFLYSIKKVLKNPGKTAREYIDGDRSRHYKPILLAFVLATFGAFLTYKGLDWEKLTTDFGKEAGYDKSFDANMMKPFEMVNSFFQNYYSLVMVLLIPIIALFSFWIMKKYKNNYYEHVIINAYYQIFVSATTVIWTLLLIAFARDNAKIVFYITFLIFPLYIIGYFWFFNEFYKEVSFGDILLRVILLVFILSIVIFILFVIAMIIVGYTIAYQNAHS